MPRLVRNKLWGDMSTKQAEGHGRKQPQERRERVKRRDSQMIGFPLPAPMAKAVKVEAARRQTPLNALFVEMRKLYRESKRAV